MVWQENLLNYLIVFLVLGSLFIIVWCKIKGQSLVELIRDLREAMSPMEE
ncbi:MAG TPA: hypothetical protein VMZ91_16000 [Candidatus Paceibacterota bacterium]|nr:hypothetical protein [Candidatus Paceibacterota bacterium]